MCSHSSSAKKVIEKLAEKLYPFIEAEFDEVLQFHQREPLPDALIKNFHTLTFEFDLLKNTELLFVFPVVQEVFNTKHYPHFKPCGNLSALQQFVHKKEALIKELVTAIHAEALRLRKSPIHSVIYTFEYLFFEEKEKWHKMVV